MKGAGVRLYVEGGGDAKTLKTACRKGFHQFIKKAGVKYKPHIVACGNRRNAYESFCTAIKNGDKAILLVDSEAPVAAPHQQNGLKKYAPWAHLKQRPGDKWSQPKGSADSDCHLMVQFMESWFLADRATLKQFFGHDFKENRLPAATRRVETIAKDDALQSLKNASADCKKGAYDKGKHSFKLLGLIDASKVIAASPWAKRFIDEL